MSTKLSAGLLRPLSELKENEKAIVALKVLQERLTDIKVTTINAQRLRYHLSLILDTSGSMKGGRLASVKETLQLLVGAMEDGDTLSIIQFNSRAYNVAEAVELNDNTRRDILQRVGQLRASGGTNLVAALKMLHVNVVGPRNPKRDVDAVFIMTDGLINGGVTNAKALHRLISATGLVARGVPVNTLGYGEDHNIQLLRDIAVQSRGTYTYADNDEMLPTIIADIIAGLATSVGYDAKLSFPEGWHCLELGIDESEKTAYKIGTLLVDKPQWIVLEGQLRKADIEARGDNLRFTVTWFGSDGSTHLISCTLADAKEIESTAVEDQLNRARVARGLALISEKLAAGDVTNAKANLEDLRKDLQQSKCKDSPFSSKLSAQVEDMHGIVELAEKTPAGQYRGPSMKSVSSRAASNASALSMQRGCYVMNQCSENAEMIQFSNEEQKASQADMKQKFMALKSMRPT